MKYGLQNMEKISTRLNLPKMNHLVKSKKLKFIILNQFSEKNLLFKLHNELYLSNHHKIFSLTFSKINLLKAIFLIKYQILQIKNLDVKLKNNNNYWITFTEDSYGKKKRILRN